MLEAAGASASKNVSMLQSRAFSSPITHSALCPQMDLLALVLNAKTVVVQRFNWQRLLTIVPSDASDERVTAITWSPDGILLAIGLDSGRLLLHTVDTAASAGLAGGRRRTTKDASAPLASKTLAKHPTALHWSTLAPLRGDGDVSVWEEAYADRADPDPAGRHSSAGRARAVLAVGDADGCITLYGCDLGFLIAKTRVMPMGTPVLTIHTSRTLHICIALGTRESHLLARSLSIRALSESYAELWRVGSESVSVASSRSSIQSHVKKISEKWSSNIDAVLNMQIFKPLHASMVSFNEAPDNYSPWKVLRDIHQSADLTGAVKHCLAAEIGENGAKEALRTFRCAVDDIEEALQTSVGLAEHLVFRAGEYAGLSSLSSKFERVGVARESAEAALAAVSALFAQLMGLMLKFYRVCSEIEAFLAWLVVVAQKADREPDEAAEVAGVSKAENELVVSFFKRHLADVDSGSADVVTRTLSGEVLPALEKFHTAAEELVISPFNALSRSLCDSEGTAFPFGLEGHFVENASISERVCGTRGECEIEVCVPTDADKVLLARYKPSEAQWRASCLDLDSLDTTVLGWNHVHGGSFLMVSSSKSALKTPKAERGLVHVQLQACKPGIVDQLFSPFKGREIEGAKVNPEEIDTLQEIALNHKLSGNVMLRAQANVVRYASHLLRISDSYFGSF